MAGFPDPEDLSEDLIVDEVGTTTWYEIAQVITSGYVGRVIPKNALVAQMAARALLNDQNNHPSNMNTAFVLTSMIEGWMRFPAFCLVVNGLTGYFQWVTHNGGKFSVLKTLVHLKIMTHEEARNPKQFEILCTHPGCGYLMVKKNLLRKVVRKFSLPFSENLGGSTATSQDEILEKKATLRWLFQKYPRGNDDENLSRLSSLIREEIG